MSIDRDSYEPISGNPRRSTTSGERSEEPSECASDSDDTEGDPPGDNSTNGDPMGPHGAQTGPDGGPNAATEAPSVPDGDQGGTDGDLKDPNGTPTGANGDKRDSEKVSDEEKSSRGEGKEGRRHPRTPSGRKRRVKVTPQDWDALEEVSNRLGVGYATVYRIAFQQYIQQEE